MHTSGFEHGNRLNLKKNISNVWNQKVNSQIREISPVKISFLNGSDHCSNDG